MNRRFTRVALSVLFSLAGAAFFTSCTVDQEAAWISRTNASGSEVKKKSEKVATEPKKQTFAERMQEKREERARLEAEAEKERARELAAEKRAEEEAERKLAAEKKAAEEQKKALVAKREREEAAREAAEEKERADRIAAKEERRRARIAAREKAEEESRARKLAEANERRARSTEVEAVATRSRGGGFFSRLAIGTPSQYKSEGHHIQVNQSVLAGLNSSNAKIEIDLSDQVARIYRNVGGFKELAIETQVSTGKSGHTTPTGTFRIQEKSVEKRSTLYGSWVNSSGATVRSSGESWARPAGGARFVGAEMPYWMRVTGGVGMHIGYVPNFPASHGCIRVPSSVQPLIYSKVGVGTPVTIHY